MRRDALRSFDTLAYYDSHSGVSKIPHSAKYARKTADKKGELAKGPIDDGDVELLHESVHWMQHIGTGYGAQINAFRQCRDALILMALRASGVSAQAISDRVIGSAQTPLLPFLDLDQTMAGLLAGDFNAMACALFWGEQLLSRRAYTQIRVRYRWIIAFCLSFVEDGFGLFSCDNDYKANLFAHTATYLSEPNIVLRTEITGDTGVSTDDIMEGGAVLSELFLSVVSGDNGRLDRRIQVSMPTSYMDAISFGHGILGTPSPESELLDVWLSMAVAIDVALDVPGYPGGRFLGFFDRDLYVPARFERALRAVKRIGCLSARYGITPLDVERYRQWLCETALLERPWRLSEELNQFRPDFYERLWQGDCEWPTVRAVAAAGDTLYSVVSYLHRRARTLRRSRGLFFGTDVLCAMLNGNGIHVDHTHFADEIDKDVFVPIVLVYEGGQLGFKEQRAAFAWLFLIASLGTYPLFNVAWVEGVVPIGPVDYTPVEVIDFRATAAELILNRFERLP